MQPPAFSTAERDRRWDLARALMDAEGVDALVVHGGAEWAPDVYFTNDRPGAIVVFPRAGEPIALVGAAAHLAGHATARARGERVWIEPENMLVAKHAHGVADTLRAHGLSRSPVGVLGLEPCPPFHADPLMPYALWSAVLGQLPQLTFKPVERAFVALALPQSAEELAAVRHAAAAGEAMALAMRDAARPGVTEAAVCAAGLAGCLEQGAVARVLGLASGRQLAACGPPAWSYRPGAPRVIEDGDLVLAEVSAAYGMREARLRLAVAVGDVHPDLERAARTARDSYLAGLAALRPGRTFGEVVAAMRRPILDTGGRHPHPLVLSVNPGGAACGAAAAPGPPGDPARYALLAEQPTIGADLRLRPGMTFAVTPTCAYGRRLAGVGGTVVVGEREPIELTTITTHLLRST
ncbi:M24 family metallopeptidase [Actinomadura sp. ATCC 31491]|uniref:M24 family metallopeptidase n=1 Tax=Actinomadura luzonensis TaxID=2805427 RepID=A0ABT0G1P0_9ACTN|nr:M24 family metallopeptidase [Actinomadura luzonensis]MCK2218532.1 M24 family metallopeptidase [Actinomadura luzonensis]